MDQPIKLGSLIANRKLALGKEKVLTVKIGRPRRMSDIPAYYCPYQILGIGYDEVRQASGVDSVHALQAVMEKIGIDLYVLNQTYDGALTWDAGEDGDLGFPLSEKVLAILKSSAPNSGTE